MRMAADHDVESRGDRIEINLIQVVQNVDIDEADLYNFALWKIIRPFSFVVVAADRNDSRNRLEFLEHIGSSDVAGVKDHVRTLEDFDRFSANQSMSV